uniref:SH2 domain-containing protein n=1 Tax=Steinernema glaseri TaxID=37863 RepID=A0A1I7XX07_9BILA
MPCDLPMRSESSPSTSHNGIADDRTSENRSPPQEALRVNGRPLKTLGGINIPRDAGDVIHHHPVFVKDTSKYWYKPTISREEAINMLRDKPPGTFVVRDSNSFPGAFGLALKVATPPPGVTVADGTELVRHFLIEPSPKGVKLKGCNNEPVFGTLSALVYQHSITPLALPTKLTLPEFDPATTPEHLSATQALLEQGAACNVVYIFSCDTESLTGPEAVRRCTEEALRLQAEGAVRPVSAHFKVSSQGITITDNTRKLFFRRHYPVHAVTHAGLDPDDRRWENTRMVPQLPASAVKKARVFGFVARKVGSRTDNACHLFAELDPDQPAQAVCNFITKVMMANTRK